MEMQNWPILESQLNYSTRMQTK